MFIKILAFIFLISSFTIYYFDIKTEKHGSPKVVSTQIKVSNEIKETINQTEILESPIFKIKDRVLLDAPIINQFPELPRGCEVTALAMLLQYKGIAVDKMDLANKVVKDQTPLRKDNNKIFWGNPNDGFIGDMYSYNNPGYGVYHEPIKKLAEEFMPGKIVDITGSDFMEVMMYLSVDSPVWVITNASYKKLPEDSFEIWQTPRGEEKITYRLHSVLITGYDENFVYFNDSLKGEKNKRATKGDFIVAWEQLGSQAITYIDKNTIQSSTFN